MFICSTTILACCANTQLTKEHQGNIEHNDERRNILESKTISINHKGKSFQLPFVVKKATSVYLYSLLDYEATCRLFEKENYKPIMLVTPEGQKKAAGFINVVDYQKTSAVPYREWAFCIFVIAKDKDAPKVYYINETSLLFQSILDDERIGYSVFSPKMILSESLPTEIGFEYYGLPKEVGEVNFNYDHPKTEFSVSTQSGPWVMKASLPKKSSGFSKLGVLVDMVKAYKIGLVFQSMKKKEFSAILVGSANIHAKMATIKSKRDPGTEMFTWNKQESQIEINSGSQWGKVLLDLMFEPQLVCFAPNLEFELSAPVDQI